MNLLLALIGLAAVVAVLLRLALLVARDGLGATSSPRSHRAELGSWVDRELRR